MENTKDLFCKNFNRILKNGHLSQRKLAHLMRVSETTVQRWRAGDNAPDFANIDILSQIYNLHPSEFFKTEHKETPILIDEAMKIISNALGFEAPVKIKNKKS